MQKKFLLVFLQDTESQICLYICKGDICDLTCMYDRKAWMFKTRPVHETSKDNQPVHETSTDNQPVHETSKDNQPVHETSKDNQPVHKRLVVIE